MDPNIDESDEYLDIKYVIIQTKPKTIPNKKFIEKSIPTYVATPFPPLNFNQIGTRCPKIARKEAIYIIFG